MSIREPWQAAVQLQRRERQHKYVTHVLKCKDCLFAEGGKLCILVLNIVTYEVLFCTNSGIFDYMNIWPESCPADGARSRLK